MSDPTKPSPAEESKGGEDAAETGRDAGPGRAPAQRTPIERPPAGAPDAPALFIDEPFPPYRFVPGVTPHPFAHADGWGHGQERPVPPLMPPEQWSENHAYLRGCDFFNRGWWWEAHETWEELWHVVEGHHPRQWELLKGLIQLAACALQRERGIDGGAERLLHSALACFERVAGVALPQSGDAGTAVESDVEGKGRLRGSAAGPLCAGDASAGSHSAGKTSRYCGLDLTSLADEARLRLSAPSVRVDGFYLRPAQINPPEDPPRDRTRPTPEAP